jgi:integrase/recombinase XerD
MKQLRNRIIRLLETGSITDQKEKQRLEFLLKTKRWNPYCILHSAITSDSDFLPEYALKKKVRSSMNSKQGSRYIKRRMGGDLKNQILVRNGIITDEYAAKQPSVLSCHRCSLVNAIDNKFCSKCSYPLRPQAYEEIKANEDLKSIQDKHEQDMKDMRERVAEMQQAVYPLLHSSQWAQIRAQVDKQVQQDPNQFVMEKLSADKPIPVVKTKVEKMIQGGYRLVKHVDNNNL